MYKLATKYVAKHATFITTSLKRHVPRIPFLQFLFSFLFFLSSLFLLIRQALDSWLTLDHSTHTQYIYFNFFSFDVSVLRNPILGTSRASLRRVHQFMDASAGIFLNNVTIPTKSATNTPLLIRTCILECRSTARRVSWLMQGPTTIKNLKKGPLKGKEQTKCRVERKFKKTRGDW